MTTEELENLHAELQRALNLIEQSPDWCEKNANGHLADMDWHALRLASESVHRLWLWSKHPTVSPESYLVAP